MADVSIDSVTKVLKDALYVGVGAGVIAFQKAQVQRRELVGQLNAQFGEAKTQFESAVKADPTMAMAHYQLGMANLNLGQIPQAREAFEGYLKADPNGPKAAEVKTFLSQLPK